MDDVFLNSISLLEFTCSESQASLWFNAWQLLTLWIVRLWLSTKALFLFASCVSSAVLTTFWVKFSSMDIGIGTWTKSSLKGSLQSVESLLPSFELTLMFSSEVAMWEYTSVASTLRYICSIHSGVFPTQYQFIGLEFITCNVKFY